MEQIIGVILQLINKYLGKQITGTEFVKEIDSMVSADELCYLSEEMKEIIDEYQDEFACYVRDEETRKQQPEVYFCDGVLVEKVTEFKEELTKDI